MKEALESENVCKREEERLENMKVSSILDKNWALHLITLLDFGCFWFCRLQCTHKPFQSKNLSYTFSNIIGRFKKVNLKSICCFCRK